MADTFEVWLDDDRRFIHQRIDGEIDAETFSRIEHRVGELVPQLRDPDNVLILFDASNGGKGTPQARRAMVAGLRRPQLRRMAVVNPRPIGRAMVRFMLMVAGVTNVRMFGDARSAVEWLLS